MKGKNSDLLRLEVLISTMNRGSLDFLYRMFPYSSITGFDILIVNQTQRNNLLKSSLNNIRVINSFQTGLSKSRNLALKNANCPIVLLSDDDVVYEENFHLYILNSYDIYAEAAAITFKIKGEDNRPFGKYPKKDQPHTLSTISKVRSVEITLNLTLIDLDKYQFNEAFGLGAPFPTAEEYLFLRLLVKSRLELVFKNNYLLTHTGKTSGSHLGSDRIIYARAALSYKLYWFFSYLWIFKYVYFLIRHNYIEYFEIKGKIVVGLKGIKEFRQITQS